MARKIIPPIERFMAKVVKTETCWIWTGVTAGSNAKYGYFRVGTRSSDPKTPAHRFAYEHFVGPIPQGMTIDHVADRGCTTKLCVNPDHLEPVTNNENMRRARLKVCRAGLHDLTIPENILWDDEGRRRGCRVCPSGQGLHRYYRSKELEHVSMQVQKR